MTVASLLGTITGIVVSLYLVFRFVRHVGLKSAALTLLAFYGLCFTLIGVFDGDVIGTLIASVITVVLVYYAYMCAACRKVEDVEQTIEEE